MPALMHRGGGCLRGDVPPEKLKNFVFLKLESCNLVNTFRCKFRAVNDLKKKKKDSSMDLLTDLNLAFWKKLWLKFC